MYNIDKIILGFLLFFTFITFTYPWSLKPWCLVNECCNDDNILHTVDTVNNLRAKIRSRVFGQHLVDIALDAIWSHFHYKPQKPLTISFHGWAGGGKNYVSTFIANSLYKYGLKSNFVHTFIGRIHFPEEAHSKEYRENLYLWLRGNLTSCPRQLFIFDEVDKMPPTVLNAIKPLIDYRPLVDKIDYSEAIFIFLSNTGSDLINEHYEELWMGGKQREDMKLSDFEHLISQGAFNEKGGFHKGDVIKTNLIDHYIPFLPMQEKHVIQCVIDQFLLRGVVNPLEHHVKEVMEFVQWGPDSSKLFSKTGCKRISSKVAVIVAKHYAQKLKTEL